MSVSAGKITLLIGRIFVGIGVGFASSVVPLYIGECSTAELRGVLVAVNIVAVTAGQLVAGLCCGAFLYVPSGWRLMLGWDKCNFMKAKMNILYLIYYTMLFVA